MSIMSREDHIRKLVRASASEIIQAALRSPTYSDLFLTRSDMHSIEDEIDKITDRVVDRFVVSLREKGYTTEGKEPTEEEFELLFQRALKSYLDQMGKA